VEDAMPARSRFTFAACLSIVSMTLGGCVASTDEEAESTADDESALSANLVTNGGFESGDPPSGWVFSTPGDAYVARTLTHYGTGRYGLRLGELGLDGGNSMSTAHVHQWVRVTANRGYKLSAYARAHQTPKDRVEWLNMEFVDSHGASLGGFGRDASWIAGWHAVSVHGQAPPGAYLAKVSIVAVGDRTYSYDWDDVSLSQCALVSQACTTSSDCCVGSCVYDSTYGRRPICK
jgi:hypothetical protein